GKSKLTSDDFAAMQADTVSLHARTLLPRLLARARPESAADVQAAQRLRAWKYDAGGDSAAAAIFSAWFLHLPPILLGDRLTPRTLESYTGRFSFVTRFLMETLTDDDS